MSAEQGTALSVVPPVLLVPGEVLDLVTDAFEQRDSARRIAVALEQENDALLRLIVDVTDEAEQMGQEYIASRLRHELAEIQRVSE